MSVQLRRYRQFYPCYPQIREALSPELARTLPTLAEIRRTRPGATSAASVQLP